MPRRSVLPVTGVLVALLVVAAGCGEAPPAAGPGPLRPAQVVPRPTPAPVVRRAARGVERLRVRGGRALLARSPVRGDRVVLVVHGRGSVAGTVFARPERARWSARLLDAGWSIATADAGGDAWGNRASVRDYRDLLAQLRRRGLRRVAIVASSMGGLAGLRLLRTVRPVAFAGVYPVYDLRSVFRLGRFADSIRAAYGFRGDRLPAAARARSPVRLPPLRGLPVILWASPTDTVVPKAANADRLAAAARVAGGRVTTFETRGEHGDPSNWDARRLLPLLDRAAGRRPVTSGRRGAPSRRGRP